MTLGMQGTASAETTVARRRGSGFGFASAAVLASSPSAPASAARKLTATVAKDPPLTTRTSVCLYRGSEQEASPRESPCGSKTWTEGGGGASEDDGDCEEEALPPPLSSRHHQLSPLSVSASGVGSLPLAFRSDR